jgi:hypothetical protein
VSYVVRFLEKTNGHGRKSRPLFVKELEVGSIAEAVRWANDVLQKTDAATLARVRSLNVHPLEAKPAPARRK